MPIKAAAAKALRQSKKREARHKEIKREIDWLKRQFSKAITNKDKKKASGFFLKLQKVLDKAVQKNALKKNTASRTKSRLAKKIVVLK